MGIRTVLAGLIINGIKTGGADTKAVDHRGIEDYNSANGCYKDIVAFDLVDGSNIVPHLLDVVPVGVRVEDSTGKTVNVNLISTTTTQVVIEVAKDYTGSTIYLWG